MQCTALDIAELRRHILSYVYPPRTLPGMRVRIDRPLFATVAIEGILVSTSAQLGCRILVAKNIENTTFPCVVCVPRSAGIRVVSSTRLPVPRRFPPSYFSFRELALLGR